jgi:hypothetical protein
MAGPGTISLSSFASVVNIAAIHNGYRVVVADVDLDGKPDLLFVNGSPTVVSVARNTSTIGSISFAAKVDFATATNPVDIAVADLDGDSKPEIVVANEGSNSLSVFRNTSVPGTINSGSFAAKVDFTSNGNAWSVAVGDLNADGKPDMVSANQQNGTISVFRNTSTSGVINSASFATATDFTTSEALDVSLADINGDGKTDVIVATDLPGASVLINNTTTSTIALAAKFSLGTYIRSAIVFDVDADGRPDLAGANMTNSLLTLFKNVMTTTPVPTITNFNPTSGGVGTSVTITGTNFSTTPTNNVVAFNGTAATVTASTATSITTTVPVGTTTGLVTVTVAGQTATSSSNFTIVPPPTITNFNPTSGIAGASVTITGTNFSATPANNIVMFNATTATVTASTATSITTTVPSGATSGPITVTVGGQTGTSSSNFTVNDSSPPTITDKTPTSIEQGANLQILATVADPQSTISSVSVEFKSVTKSGSATIQAMTLSGGDYSYTIPSSEIGELGIEYRITATSGGGSTTPGTFKTVAINFPASGTGLTIPYSSFGSTVSAYRIVAVPLQLTSKTTNGIFNELGAYDPEKWRMYHYAEGQTTELTGTSQIDPGWGYWLIIRDNPGNAINSGSGNSVNVTSASPLQISLKAGWNQIGNPYNFNLSWADVQAANAGLPGLRIYDGDFADGTRLDKMQGGFVNVPSDRTLTFPVVKNNSVNSGRLHDEPTVQNPLNEPNWQVVLNVEHGAMTNTISGFGMNQKASDRFDAFDGFNMPYFFDTYVRLNHAKKEGKSAYSKDIVPTQANYVWEFSVESTLKERNITLRWDNSYFGENDRQLFLWDERQQRSVDMRNLNSYTFDKATSGSFKVIFGYAEFVKEMVEVNELVLHNVWPNPAAGDVKISFTVPQSTTAMPLEFSVADITGKQHWTSSANFQSGYNEVVWKRTDAPAGVYFVQVQCGRIMKTTKLILK